MGNKVTNNWNKLAENYVVSYYTRPILVNNAKYFLMIGDGAVDNYGIVMYDIQNDCYPVNLRHKHPENSKLEGPAMAYDGKNIIYIWGGYNHPFFMIYDLLTKETEIIVTQNTAKKIKDKYNIKHVGTYSRAVCDTQKLHVIGGTKSNTHMIFNANEQVFKEQYIFEFKNFRGFGLVFDSINDRLILFGGKDDNKYFDHIWFFDISTNIWTECSDFVISIKLAYFGFVFLSDLQIILLFGGAINDYKDTDNILFLDLKNHSCTKILAKCPKKAMYHALFVPNLNSNQKPYGNIHLFKHDTSGDHWSTSIESIFPYNYHQSPLKSNININSESNEETVIFKGKSNENSGNEQLSAVSNISEKKEMDESKDNMNNEELLNARERSFKTYIYSVIAKSADKYYETFVKNEFNDLEIVIEFARMKDENESLRILCKDCDMNAMHARQLLRRLTQLSENNSKFENWFKTNQMSKYYEMMLNAGVVTFMMFEDTFVCCTDFVEFLGEQNEKEGIFIWRNIPLKRNINEKKHDMRKNKNESTSVIVTATNNLNFAVSDEGHEGH